MKRWHLTLGLAGTALVAAALAPRLQAYFVAPQILIEPYIEPDLEPPTPVQQPAREQGRLVVEAALDRSAVLADTATERFLTITITAPEPDATATRSPVNVAVVMDASGSMSAADKMAQAKAATKAVVKAMAPTDTFSLVTFNDDARVVIPAHSPTSHADLNRKIDSIYEDGGTNLYAGMELGRQEVLRVLDTGEVGRLIILSDGMANVGIIDPNTLARYASEASTKGISVSAMGIGVAYNEDLLAWIADVGGGTYDYIDDPSELTSVFAAELQRTSTILTRRTSVTIELPENVQPLDIIGWDADPHPHGWTVFVGDMYAGATRKIVARVRLLPTAVGTFPVASVRADYIDLQGDHPALSTASASASATYDPTLIAGSLDPEAAAAASLAWGNHFLEMSTQAYEDGDVRRAGALLEQGSSVLKKAGAETGDSLLIRGAHHLESRRDIYISAKPSSDRGRRAIKMNKETVRAASR